MTAASDVRLRSTRSRNRMRIRARRSGGAAAQAGNAAAAAATASFTSAAFAIATRRAWRPGGRVVDVAEAARRAFMRLAADEMRRQGKGGLVGGGGRSSAVELFDADMME